MGVEIFYILHVTINIKVLEKVQKKAVSLISGLKGETYKAKLKEINVTRN